METAAPAAKKAPAKKPATRTHAQSVTAQNDKFRAEQLKQNLDEYQRLERSDDLDQFRAESYKQALKDAKAQRP